MQQVWQKVVEMVSDCLGEPRRVGGIRIRWLQGEEALVGVTRIIAAGAEVVEALRQDDRAAAVAATVKRFELEPRYDCLSGLAGRDAAGVEAALTGDHGHAVVSQCVQVSYRALGAAEERLHELEQIFLALWRDLARLKVDSEALAAPVQQKVLGLLPELAVGVKSLIDRTRDAVNWNRVLMETLDACVTRRPAVTGCSCQEETVAAPPC